MNDVTPSHVMLTWEKYQAIIQRIADLEASISDVEGQSNMWRSEFILACERCGLETSDLPEVGALGDAVRCIVAECNAWESEVHRACDLLSVPKDHRLPGASGLIDAIRRIGIEWIVAGNTRRVNGLLIGMPFVEVRGTIDADLDEDSDRHRNGSDND